MFQSQNYFHACHGFPSFILWNKVFLLLQCTSKPPFSLPPNVTPLGSLERSLLRAKRGKYWETSWQNLVTQASSQWKRATVSPSTVSRPRGRIGWVYNCLLGFCWLQPCQQTHSGSATPSKLSSSEAVFNDSIYSLTVPLTFHPFSSGTQPSPISTQLSATMKPARPPTISSPWNVAGVPEELMCFLFCLILVNLNVNSYMWRVTTTLDTGLEHSTLTRIFPSIYSKHTWYSSIPTNQIHTGLHT